MKRSALFIASLSVAFSIAQSDCESDDLDEDGWTVDDGDCDDLDPSTHPGAEEVCDGVDNDCDDLTDEDVTSVFYADTDQDGYGDPANSTEACTAPRGYVSNSADCDDNDPSVYPGTEDCQFESCADIYDVGAGDGDGLYTIDPDGPGDTFSSMVVYCDLTTGDAGWTRVFTISLGTGCTVTTDATAQDPADDNQNCAKYSDALINQIARDRIFFSRIDDYPPLFTHYSDAIDTNGYPGTVIQSDSFEEALALEPVYQISYGAWIFFHQENWYASDTCLGAPDDSYRLSLQYISDPNMCEGCVKHACSGTCGSQCPIYIDSGQAEVYIR